MAAGLFLSRVAAALCVCAFKKVHGAPYHSVSVQPGSPGKKGGGLSVEREG